MTDPIRGALATVAAGEALDTDAAEAFMAAVLDGEVTPAQLAGLLMALRVRGERTEELTGFVRAMRSRAVAVTAPAGTIDICGTGGDIHSTFNVSTAASLVVAAAGVPIAKAGNRAVSSTSGSSDVMAALGLTVEQSADEAEASLRDEGYAYLHAPAFHPGMRHAGPVRMELGVRTAFNLIGPIANPARPRRQLMGVPDEDAAQKAAATLQALGSERAFVVTGDRIDELPLDDSGVILDVSPERRRPSHGDRGRPRTAGSLDRRRCAAATPPRTPRSSRRSSTAASAGPRRDVVVLNAGCGAPRRRGRDRPPRRRRARRRGHRLGCRGRAPRSSSGSGPRRGPRQRARRDDGRRPVRRRPFPRRPGARPSSTRSPSSAAPTSSASCAGVDVRAARARRGGRARAARRRGPASRVPGLHLIAEIKRRSPSAGALADGDLDVASRARAYQAGGAAVISVLVENRYFGGSIDDLRAARAATTLPVLAKEFVVDARQLPLLRAAGADAVLLLAALHPARRLARLVRDALDLGLEPLVEAHDARELDAALGTDARIIGINNRDLRTLTVDPELADRLRDRIPADRIAVAESGVRDAAILRRWRALGYDAALVGEELMRSGHDPAAVRARVAAFVDAGADPVPGTDPAVDGRRPFVKICGLTEPRGPRGGPRGRRRRDRAQLRPGHAARALGGRGRRSSSRVARAATAPGLGPRLVGVFADRPADEVAAIASRLGLDAVQLQRRRATRRPRSHPAPGPEGRSICRQRSTRRPRMPTQPDRRRRRRASRVLPREAEPRGDPPRHERPVGARRDRASRLDDRRSRGRRPRSRSSSPAASIPRTSGRRSSTFPPSASTSRAGSSPCHGRPVDPRRTRSVSRSSSSAPAPPASTVRPSPSGHDRSTPGCSSPMPAAAGVSTARSAAGSCPRR